VNPNSSVVCNFRFPGQYYDNETGLHYNWHRYYDPQTGRYLRPDPIGLLGGINLFKYSLNNPINSIDPLGLAEYILAFNMDTATVGAGVATVKGIIVDPTPRPDGQYTALEFRGAFVGGSGSPIPVSSLTIVAVFEDDLSEPDLFNISGDSFIITSCSITVGDNSVSLGKATKFGNLRLKKTESISGFNLEAGSVFKGNISTSNRSFILPKEQYYFMRRGFKP